MASSLDAKIAESWVGWLPRRRNRLIEDLPPWMVEAFHSTLEEIALSDVVLLVVDASDPIDEMKRRLRSSLRILWEFDGRSATEPNASTGAGWPRSGAQSDLGGPSEPVSAVALAAPDEEALPVPPEASPVRAAPTPTPIPGRPNGGIPFREGLAPVVVALNKTDRISATELAAKKAALFDDSLTSPDMCVAVSATTRAGLDDLFALLYSLIPDYDEYEVALPASPESEAFIGWLHGAADVLDMTRGNEVHMHFEARRSRRTELLSRLAAIGATALHEVQRQPFAVDVSTRDGGTASRAASPAHEADPSGAAPAPGAPSATSPSPGPDGSGPAPRPE